MNLWRGISGEVSLATSLMRWITDDASQTAHHRRRITDDASQTTSRTTLGSACQFFSLSSLSLSHCRAFAGEGGCAERCAGCRGAGVAGGGDGAV